jgi:hypothetical protein
MTALPLALAGCFGAGAVRQVGDNYTDRFVLAGSEFCGFQLHQEVCALGGIDRVLALPDGFGRVARKLLASKKKVTTCRLASRLASPRLTSYAAAPRPACCRCRFWFPLFDL